MTGERTELEGAVTIVLADGYAVVRSGLRLLLNSVPGLKVIAEAEDAVEANRCARRHKPDVLVLDLDMPGRPTLEVVPEIRGAAPQTGIVVLTMDDGIARARSALEAGAGAYVLKEAAEADLVRAIRMVARGETYLDPALANRLDRSSGLNGTTLSEREREVLQLVALGHTNQEVASRLFISVRTVEDHRARLSRKLGLETRAQLVRFALGSGLVRA